MVILIHGTLGVDGGWPWGGHSRLDVFNANRNLAESQGAENQPLYRNVMGYIYLYMYRYQ